MRVVVGLMATVLAVSGCAASPKNPVSAGDRYSTATAGTEDYLLGTGDKVRLTVFNEPTLSGDFSVNANGNISVPLIGDVPASGKKSSQVADAIRDAFANGYLRDPKVSLEVTTYRPFFILGEVKLPGQYPYINAMTALNAIAIAQGFTPRSDRTVVYIRRAGSDNEETFRLTPDLKIWPGDTIRLKEKYF